MMISLPPPPLLDPAAALFVDIDGTLVEIAAAPEAVRVSPALPRLLERLQLRHGGAFALVSGRPITGIDALFRPWHGAAAGLHGGERRRLDGSRAELLDPEAAAALERLRPSATEVARRFPGVRLEDKGRTLALHYRAVPAAEAEILRFADEAVRASDNRVRLMRGKMAAELLPCGQSKGRAIAAFLGEAPFRGRMPVFVGDDVTDEDGFAEVRRRGGVAVRVGPAAADTAAVFSLPGVAAVLAWLAAGSNR